MKKRGRDEVTITGMSQEAAGLYKTGIEKKTATTITLELIDAILAGNAKKAVEIIDNNQNPKVQRYFVEADLRVGKGKDVGTALEISKRYPAMAEVTNRLQTIEARLDKEADEKRAGSKRPRKDDGAAAPASPRDSSPASLPSTASPRAGRSPSPEIDTLSPESQLLDAVKRGNVAQAKEILEEVGANPNKPEAREATTGKTVLHIAAGNITRDGQKAIDMFILLRDHVTDKNAKDNAGQTVTAILEQQKQALVKQVGALRTSAADPATPPEASASSRKEANTLLIRSAQVDALARKVLESKPAAVIESSAKAPPPAQVKAASRERT